MQSLKPIKLIECPRDAMQGWPHFIDTGKKIVYLNKLLEVGFDTIDFGSFVSAKAIPQMADVREVLAGLERESTQSKLLAIVANRRGAEDALAYDEISFLGFPFSVSETFQQRNTNSGIEESFGTVESMQQLISGSNKRLVVYLSMAFGNPYGDEYNENIVAQWAEKIATLGVEVISLADTVGLATVEQVLRVTKHVISLLPGVEVGVHLHSTPEGRKEKVLAALSAGCTRFDSAINGIGGCPMAGNALVGNMDTLEMIKTFESEGIIPLIDRHQLDECSQMASEIFV